MAKHEADSQVTLILNHLKTGASINPLEAFSKYGVYRLGAVIYILREEGYDISTQKVYYKKPSGRRGNYAVYRLEECKNGK